MKSTATGIHTTNGSAKVEERDGSTVQASTAQSQNNCSDAQSSDSSQQTHNNDIVMSEDDPENERNAAKSTKTMSEKEGISSSEDEESDDSDSDGSDNENEKDERTANNNKTTSISKRSFKLLPIDVWTDNKADIQRKIQNIVPSNSCLYSRVNNMKFRVLPSDAKTRSIVIDYLREKNYNYNTYTPSDSKMINVIIKGLDHIDDVDTIKCELAEKGFEPYQIKKHITGYMRKNNSKSNLWLIVLQPNSDTKELFKIKAIDHAIVKFEFLRKPKVTQCRRCQRFNHSA